MRRISITIFNREFRLVRFKQCFLVALLCLLLSNAAEAIPMFNMTTTDKVVSLAVGSTATITYTVQNNIGVDISNMQYFPPPLTSISAGSTCSSTLAEGASCNIILTLRAPTAPGSLLLKPLHACGFGNGTICSTANKVNRVQLNILDAAPGHFVFRQGATDITSLDLSPNDTGTVTLHNTGGSVISGMVLTIPPVVSSYFSGSCTTATSLAAGASCSLDYTIPATPVSGMHNLMVTGNNVDNSPHTLIFDISSLDFSTYYPGTTCGAYSFIDISGTGALVPGTFGDDVAGNITLAAGHPINIFGALYTQLRVSSNGFISNSLTSGSEYHNACPLPGTLPARSGSRILPLHEDLISSAIYYQYFNSCPRPSTFLATEGCHVFMWNNATQFGGAGPFDFETVIYDISGETTFQYAPGNPEQGSDSTTGVVNVTGNPAVTLVCDTPGSILPNSVRCLKHIP